MSAEQRIKSLGIVRSVLGASSLRGGLPLILKAVIEVDSKSAIAAM